MKIILKRTGHKGSGWARTRVLIAPGTSSGLQWISVLVSRVELAKFHAS